MLLVLSLRNGCELSSWLMGLHFQLEWVFAFLWSFALRVFLLEPLLLRTILYFLQAEYKKKKKPKKASPGVTTPTRPSSGKRTRVAVDESRPLSGETSAPQALQALPAPEAPPARAHALLSTRRRMSRSIRLPRHGAQSRADARAGTSRQRATVRVQTRRRPAGREAPAF